jgi:hypothetical protein
MLYKMNSLKGRFGFIKAADAFIAAAQTNDVNDAWFEFDVSDDVTADHPVCVDNFARAEAVFVKRFTRSQSPRCESCEAPLTEDEVFFNHGMCDECTAQCEEDARALRPYQRINA